MIPIACTILHNFLLTETIDDEYMRMYLDEDVPPGDATGPNEDYENVEDELVPELVPQDRRGMGRFKNSLVDQMHATYIQNP